MDKRIVRVGVQLAQTFVPGIDSTKTHIFGGMAVGI